LGGIDGEFAEFPPQPERPKIVSVRDVPNDNGRQVFVTWKCPEDGMNSMINEYAVYRLDGKLLTFLVKVPATRDSIYQVVAPTLGDSNKVNGLWLSTFVIRALTPFPGQHYTSDPFNGYSIDNLPPHAPTGLNASLLAGMLTIKWERSMDKDFQYYAVYRSNTPIVSTEGLRPYYVDTSTVFTERTTAGVTYYYRITVFDWNGNESKPSDQIKTDGNSVVSVEGTDEVPKAFTLNQNYPNPFNPSTTIAYDIPSASFVSLKVYTILGQEVMTLVESQHQPGRYTITFSANGLSSGMYIYKLTAGQFQSVKRMLLMK
jgi:hypothetical protein